MQAQSDTTTSEQSQAPAPSSGQGFIKKLFKGVQKVQKTAQKEAKVLQKLENLQTRIYGWYPYWNNIPDPELNYNLLTTFSYFSIDGNLDPASDEIVFDDHGIASPNVKSHLLTASRAGCRVDVTFKFDDKKTINALLNNKAVQDSCIASIVRIINSNYVYDGICIVFENLPANVSSSLVSFMTALKVTLKPSNRTISLALPAIDYANNYDVSKLNKIVDTYILLCYNYYTKGSEPGPVSPLDDLRKNMSIKSTVKDYLDKAIPYSKMIVALPFYGSVWKEDAKGNGHYSFYKHWTYSQIKNNLAVTGATVKLDTVSYTNYYDFTLDGENYTCYFDNDKSLDRKYKWLIKLGIAGVGIWALGYDKGSQDFWEMINKNYKVKKLTPLKKEVIIDNKTLRDTVFSYLLIGDSLVKHTNLIKDTLIKDTLFSKIIPSDADTSGVAPEMSYLTAKLNQLKSIFKPLISNKRVAIAIILTLIVFGLAGLLGSLFFSSVRSLLYITSVVHYIITNIILILAGLGLFSFLRFLKTDIIEILPGHYNSIYTGLWIVLIIGWLIINLLSYKLIGTISLKGERP